MDTTPRSPLRLVAPAALIAFGLALMIIVAGGGGSGQSSSSSKATRREQRDLGLKGSTGHQTGEGGGTRLSQLVYIIKTGDTLATIAQKTGVSVSRIQELNPNIDPQALVSGQRLKLR